MSSFVDSVTRFRILQRDFFTCRYCGRRAPHVELEVDHVHPRAKNGKDEDSNLVAACIDCNRAKRAKIVELPGVWDSLEHKFFHDVKRGRQGRVIGLAHGYVVVRFLDWLMGAEDWYARVVTFDEIVSGEWLFYESDEEMRNAYEYGGVAERIKAEAERA